MCHEASVISGIGGIANTGLGKGYCWNGFGFGGRSASPRWARGRGAPGRCLAPPGWTSGTGLAIGEADAVGAGGGGISSSRGQRKSSARPGLGGSRSPLARATKNGCCVREPRVAAAIGAPARLGVTERITSRPFDSVSVSVSPIWLGLSPLSRRVISWITDCVSAGRTISIGDLLLAAAGRQRLERDAHVVGLEIRRLAPMLGSRCTGAAGQGPGDAWPGARVLGEGVAFWPLAARSAADRRRRPRCGPLRIDALLLRLGAGQRNCAFLAGGIHVALHLPLDEEGQLAIAGRREIVAFGIAQAHDLARDVGAAVAELAVLVGALLVGVDVACAVAQRALADHLVDRLDVLVPVGAAHDRQADPVDRDAACGAARARCDRRAAPYCARQSPWPTASRRPLGEPDAAAVGHAEHHHDDMDLLLGDEILERLGVVLDVARPSEANGAVPALQLQAGLARHRVEQAAEQAFGEVVADHEAAPGVVLGERIEEVGGRPRAVLLGDCGWARPVQAAGTSRADASTQSRRALQRR